MKAKISFNGFALVAGNWVALSDKLNFPEEIVGSSPFEYAQELMSQAGIEHYLVTYNKIQTQE